MNDDVLIDDVLSSFLSLKQDSKVSLKKELIPSPNFSKRKLPVDFIVVYLSGTRRIGSMIEHFESSESQASYHYIIGVDGRVVQMVDDEHSSWHFGFDEINGKKNVNDRSVSIAFIGKSQSDITSQQLKSFGLICSDLIMRYNISSHNIYDGGFYDPYSYHDLALAMEKIHSAVELELSNQEYEFESITSNEPDLTCEHDEIYMNENYIYDKRNYRPGLLRRLWSSIIGVFS